MNSWCHKYMYSFVCLVTEIILTFRLSVHTIIPTTIFDIPHIWWLLEDFSIPLRKYGHVSIFISWNSIQVFTNSNWLASTSQTKHIRVYELMILKHFLVLEICVPLQRETNPNYCNINNWLLILLWFCKVFSKILKLYKFLNYLLFRQVFTNLNIIKAEVVSEKFCVLNCPILGFIIQKRL